MLVDTKVTEEVRLTVLSEDLLWADQDKQEKFLEDLQEDLDKNRIFSLKQVTYLGASGVNFLSQVIKQVRKAKGDLRLAEVSPRISMVLRLVGFDRIFDIYPTVDDALHSYQACLNGRERAMLWK